MSAHAPNLNRFLRDHGVVYVRAEYTGRDDRGEFVALQTHSLVRGLAEPLLWCQPVQC
jgi:hypothetical protein